MFWYEYEWNGRKIIKYVYFKYSWLVEVYSEEEGILWDNLYTTALDWIESIVYGY